MTAINVANHGSLHNAMYAQMRDGETPKVGTHVTFISWSDRSPGTVVRVNKTGKTIWVRRNVAKALHRNGPTECQDWEIGEELEGSECCYTLRKNGKYVAKGDSIRGATLLIGRRMMYRDPSF